MAVVARGFRKYFQPKYKVLANALLGNDTRLQVVRTCYYDKQKFHGNDYDYEISFNPKEWHYVERLIPMRRIPEVKEKERYPSGWRPQTEEAKNHPYFVERSKNHMLPVYLLIRMRGQSRVTKVKNIRGDIWKLHDDLKEYLKKEMDKNVFMYVLEGNCAIEIKGDVVYYVEQWLLSKGF